MTLLISRDDRAVSHKQNPLDLKIGDQIVFNKITTFEYVESKKKEAIKRLVRTESVLTEAYICGIVKRGEGVWHQGFRSLEGYESATFTTTKYFWLYECRTSLLSKPILIFPNDIVRH
jgi:hypothetical protein